MTTQTSTDTAPIFPLSEVLGVDENALVDAFYSMSQGLPFAATKHLTDARQAIAVLEFQAVKELRKRGESWAVVGATLGTSAQGAHKRFAAVLRHLELDAS